MKAPLPPNEAQRLEALRQYDVLDTSPEQAFDDLALLASHICQTPIALVSLVDENRQWFKAKVGVSAVETSRDIAFCAHTILHKDEVLEVRDAGADPRFADSLLVTSDPHIRFYAGAPLVTPEGHALGALCVMDRTPRTLTADQLAALRALSRHVVAQMELQRQARKLANEAAERQRAETQLRQQVTQLAASKDQTDQLLTLAQKSRRALLSVLEDEKRAGQNLRESEARFRQLAENIDEVFWMTNPAKNQMLYISPGYEKIWGRTCASLYAAPQTWLDAIHPEDRERILQAMVRQPDGNYDEEYRIIRPDGQVRWMRDRAFPVRNATGQVERVVGVAGDITERKQVQSQMLRAQRLESIGTLAGGIAHDLNNALTPILMVTEMLRMQYPEATDLVDTLESSAKRAADMVRQLLTFAKGVEGARLQVQPQHLLEEMQKIIKATFPKNIRLRTNCKKDLQPILGDATQLHQVLLNLCVNARDAMPNGGTLTLEAENIEIDATYASAFSEAKPGRYIVWRVIDTGTGISPEVLERIFEPFFTTKGPDQGTGLGLSTVIGIIKSHGGFVRVYSQPGVGSTFAVYLPCAGDNNEAPSSVKEAKETFRGNGETILVVDDEANVRQIARSVLTALNFTVVTASDGTEALVQVAEKRAELRGVITDLHMPHMDGLGFVRVLKHMLPDAGIIVASGRVSESEASEFKTLGVSVLLDKPFTQEQLIEALKTVLKR